MINEYGFTEARNDFSRVFNSVYNELKPAIIKRNRDQEILMVRKDLLRAYLTPVEFKVEVYREEDGSITLSMDALEIAVNAPDMDRAVEELVKELKDYTTEYLERSMLFLNSPNRKPHFPYILRLMLCDSDEEIKSLFRLSHAS
ncbi:exoribonuclease R [Thermosediminibacter litoriperuensis]|uniref:Antitoxin of RelE/RelB toxin-antitoxin system n=1 Tax=Thermosediminibacter litoriperuensis TaxID=291989 RepID=A0A5S5AMT7_9FIRM|nr:exoribonuclease R [Thermosediminibacter litoriperuensis]TYP52492.1 antitoxin of RelE/RelB toxin-antitoxin system [Thermosediminibacter litoriperuensis]